jgi:hypothetical protein
LVADIDGQHGRQKIKANTGQVEHTADSQQSRYPEIQKEERHRKAEQSDHPSTMKTAA